MENKIKIKLGILEIEYEGSNEYIKNDLPILIDKLNSLTNDVFKNDIEEINNSDIASETKVETSKVNSENLSINSVAAKIGGKTGNELLIASAAQLNIYQGKDVFSRTDLLNEMKGATNYFKKTYSSNLSKTLKRIVSSGKLIERNGGNYAFSANELSSIKSKLGVN